MEHREKILDLRETSFFEKGHIPGSISFPIFEKGELEDVQNMSVEDRERHFRSKYQKMESSLVDKLGYQSFTYYCQKGEVESRFFKNWFGPEFQEGKSLKGGYNAYRKRVNRFWAEKHELIVITGLTGSGKTEVLEILEREGYPVLNLEKITNHKGSVFGGIDADTEISQEQFENEIYWLFQQDGPIIMEMKGRYLGQLYLPIQFYEQIEKAPKIQLEVPLNLRVARLVDTYCGKDDSFLRRQVELLGDRLADNDLKRATGALENSDYRLFIEILLHYYDQSSVYRKMGEDPGFKVNGTTPEAFVSIIKKVLPHKKK